MVGDYDGDSLFDEKLDLLLWLVQIGMNVDLGGKGCQLSGLLIDRTSRERGDQRQG